MSQKTLTADQKKAYRTIGHDLNPIVTVAGNGLSDGVLLELERALDDHELIKVKLAVGGPNIRKTVINEMLQETGAILVQSIGKIALLYKPASKPDPKKSNILRSR